MIPGRLVPKKTKERKKKKERKRRRRKGEAPETTNLDGCKHDIKELGIKRGEGKYAGEGLGKKNFVNFESISLW